MGIKIKNDTEHDVLVLVFTYLPMPLPSLFYRKTLLIPRGERINCPTWQSAVKIYAWEADANGAAIRVNLERRFGKINAARLVLAPIGGEVVAAVGDAVSIAIDGIMDAAIHMVIEAAAEQVMGKLEVMAENADEDLERYQKQCIKQAQSGQQMNFRTSMTQKTFYISQNALFLRRQFSVHRNDMNDLEINGSGMSWF